MSEAEEPPHRQCGRCRKVFEGDPVFTTFFSRRSEAGNKATYTYDPRHRHPAPPERHRPGLPGLGGKSFHPESGQFIIFGAMIDESVVDQVWVTVVATGYGDRPLMRSENGREPPRPGR